MRRTATLVVASLAAILLGGCASQSATFDGRPRDQVWTAMVAVAEQPEYPDWNLIENEVSIIPDRSRILVYRRLEVMRQAVGASPVEMKREWSFEITLDPPQEGKPPKVTFASTAMVLPARLKDEAERYFTAVGELLGEVKVPPAPKAPSTAPPSAVRGE